jgi:hypothetical protein
MARARWAKDRAERDAGMVERLREIAEIDVINLPRKQGDMLGTMQWSCARTGKVRRWVIRIGDRADRITIGDNQKSHGWSWFFSILRKKILNH